MSWALVHFFSLTFAISAESNRDNSSNLNLGDYVLPITRSWHIGIYCYQFSGLRCWGGSLHSLGLQMVALAPALMLLFQLSCFYSGWGERGNNRGPRVYLPADVVLLLRAFVVGSYNDFCLHVVSSLPYLSGKLVNVFLPTCIITLNKVSIPVLRSMDIAYNEAICLCPNSNSRERRLDIFHTELFRNTLC